jgi:alpha-L-fucosidase
MTVLRYIRASCVAAELLSFAPCGSKNHSSAQERLINKQSSMSLSLRSSIYLVSITVVFAFCKQQSDYIPDPDPQIRKRIEEWQDLKFGLLLHWGPYSQWGVAESWSICPEDLSWAAGARKEGVAEYYFDYVKKYEALKKTFNPTSFAPEKWAAAAKNAGMKYVVFTTKHHDGFSMFDSQYTDYKVTDKSCPFSSNPRSNITREIFAAFRKENFWTGAYFSKPDWHSNDYWWRKFPPADRNPNYSIQKHPERWKAFVAFTHNQIRELMTGYGPIDILWLDGSWVKKKPPAEVDYEMKEEFEGSRWVRNPQSQDLQMDQLVKEARTHQPKLIVVDRGVRGPNQNYLTPEQHIPANGLPYPWETCMTMGDSWSYKPGDKYKSTDELIKKLVDVVSKGGNFLLNIGPKPDGELDSIAYNRLAEIGAWIKMNGESIYGTRSYTVFGEGDSIRYTQSKDGKTQYIIFLSPSGKTARLSKIQFNKSTKLQWLGYTGTVAWENAGGKPAITFPTRQPVLGSNVIVLKATRQ